MKDWTKDEAFTTWTEAQKRLWESLSSGVPAFQPPKSMGVWRETYLKNLSAWEGAVRQSLDMQSAWVKQWARQVASEQGTPESMAEWTQQVEEVMQHWIDTQSKLWDDWFEMLKSTASGAERLQSEIRPPAARPPIPEPAPSASVPKEEKPPQPAPLAAKAEEPAPVPPETEQAKVPPAAGPSPAKPKTSKAGTSQRRSRAKKKEEGQ